MQWLVLGVIIIGWILIKIYESVSEGISSSNRNIEQKRKFEEERLSKYSERSIDLSRNLYERNQDIIKKYEKNISSHSSRYYYIENETRDCINEICLAENKSNLRPGSSYLSSWVTNAPEEYKELANAIKKLFSDKQRNLKEFEAQEHKLETKRNFEKLQHKYSELIEQFNDVAYRKVTIIDSYGEESWDALEKEIDLVVEKIARKEGIDSEDFRKWKKHSFYIPENFVMLREHLKSSFDIYYKQKKGRAVNTTDFTDMPGVEFEVYLANLLKANGFQNVTGTTATGDQGADLIAKKDGKTIIIQAKRYGTTVGNKAVQEVISALSFYGGDEGWVMTNSSFTKSAKELAGKSGIRLFDGHDLMHFTDILKTA